MHSISIRKNQKKRGVHNEYDVEMEMVLTPLCGAKIMNLFDKSKYFCIFFSKNNENRIFRSIVAVRIVYFQSRQCEKDYLMLVAESLESLLASVPELLDLSWLGIGYFLRQRFIGHSSLKYLKSLRKIKPMP